MTTEQIFKTSSLFKTVTFEEDTDSWHFYFEDNIYVSAASFWRLLKANRIVLVSLDNGHQFGKHNPLNLVEEINKDLKGKELKEIKVCQDTADLVLTISDNLKIEIFTSSVGYETYYFSVQGKRIICLGSGDIAIQDSK